MYDIKVTKLENENSNVIGLASLVVDGQMKFNNIRLVKNDSEKGFFVSMPSYKKADGEYENYFHPITREMVDKMTDAAAKSLESGETVRFYTTYQTEVFHVSVDTRDTFGGTSVKMRISDDFVCNSIQIRENKQDKTMFVAMPSYKKKDGTYENICYPITADFRSKLYEKILNEREHSIEKSFAQSKEPEIVKAEETPLSEKSEQALSFPTKEKSSDEKEDLKETPAKESKKTQARKGRSR